MASCKLSTTEQTSLATKLNTDIGGGTLNIYSGSDTNGPNGAAAGTLLASFTLPAAAGNSISNGVITLGSISNVNAGAAGTAGWARILTSGAAVVMDLDVGTSGASVNLINLSIADGQPVSITSATITVPEGS